MTDEPTIIYDSFRREECCLCGDFIEPDEPRVIESYDEIKVAHRHCYKEAGEN